MTLILIHSLPGDVAPAALTSICVFNGPRSLPTCESSRIDPLHELR